ncbi:MAG: hypothetical protein H6Q56_324, partial [Deltaproteobacteria bacterium]|nr:hypothetical protein [Deltaproteobacteria bacterium]
MLMKSHIKTTLLGLLIVAALACAPRAFAYTYGSNITYYDGEGSGSIGMPRENNEAEPGMIQSQVWDLEGFYRKGNVLSMIGGFNFKSAVSGYPTFTSGDLFISTAGGYGAPLGSVASGDGYNNTNNNYGYEYVLQINWTSLAFNVLKLDPTETTTTVWYNLNETGTATSNPWKYVSGGNPVPFGSGVGTDRILTSAEAQTLGLVDWNGPTYTNDIHYAVSFDLSSVFADANLYGKE